MKNHYFTDGLRSEQGLYEDIIIESLKIYGQDLYYLPRDIVNEDTIFGEDVRSSFNSSYKIEMYIENTEGFDGEGDLFTKFGVEIRDEATFIVSRRRWAQTVSRYDNDINSNRPREGDLIYLPLSNKLFEITFVEHEQPFYQLSNLPVYKLRAQLFEYSGEDFDTDLGEVQDIEKDYSFRFELTVDSAANFVVGETVTQTLSDGTILSGEVTRYSDSDKTVWLSHFGGDDGNFHLPVVGLSLVGAEDSAEVVSYIENNMLSENEQNDTFDNLDFLDFSESNPFGDPQ